MESTAKTALAVGAGVLIGKLGGGLGWWLLGGATALFIMKSPATQAAIKTGATKAYSAIKKR